MQKAEENCMEQKALSSVQFKSKGNPNVKVTLEFSGSRDGSTVETEITSVLMERYLKKVLSGSMQSGAQALLSSHLREMEERTYE